MDTDKNNNEYFSEYGNEADDGVMGLVPYGFNSDSDESLDLPSKSQTRKRRGKVVNQAWFAAKNKKLRENGKTYLGKKKVNGVWNHRRVRNARAIGERCRCKKATGSATLHCAEVTEDQRQVIFKQFWQMDWKEKQTYVNTLIQATTPARMRNRKHIQQTRRGRTLQYHVRVEQKNVKVCQKFFLNTLSIGKRTVLNWVKQTTISTNTTQNAPQKNCSIARQNLNSFFDSLPTMESHYCRATTNKTYLLPEWSSKKQLYDFYVEDFCKARGGTPLSISAFHDAFAVKNLGLHYPKKDQCEICARHSVGDILDDVYNLHQTKKHEAREEKQKDKIEEAFVFTVDLQAVLMAPKSQVSSLYYRTKLQVHNLVFYNLISHDAYCFIWNEVEGGVSAEEFASIWVYFIENKIIPKLTENAAATKIILYSDGCTYQNRNVSMSNALLNTSIKHGVTIEQKILETGHTQMEADSVHSVIERAIKHRVVNIPAEYIEICRNARKKPTPYMVEYLDHTFFKCFKSIPYLKTIRPGRGKGESKVTDIRAIKYTPQCEIFYKLRFPEPWSYLQQRVDRSVVPTEWSNLTQLHQERRKLTARKYADLQYIKTSLPRDFHQYYDDLPHE